MKLLLIISSLAVLLFTGLYLYEETMLPDWKQHQQNYRERLENDADSNQLGKDNKPSYMIELRQIWLPELNRADRCISCHAAIENPEFKDTSHPLKVHPDNLFEVHEPQNYGCTICHDGQGRAISFREAKADDPEVFWNKPLLRQPFIQANCYRCHIDTLTQTPDYNSGKSTFESGGCLGCHKRNGKGGFEGPELGFIGDASPTIKYPENSSNPDISPLAKNNKNVTYIYESVRYPGIKPEDSRMFDFKFSHDQTLVLAVYLKSLTKKVPGTQLLLPKPVSPLTNTQRGEKSFHLYCTACHGKSGRGGVKNPNYKNDFIPRLNTLAKQMYLHKQNHRDMVVAMLDEYIDLMDGAEQPDIPGFYKVIAKYMPVKNIIQNGRVAEKKDENAPSPLNMPVWGKTLSSKEISDIMAYLISVY